MILDPTQLSNFFMILTVYSGVFLTALWFSAIIWTYRDIRARSRDPLLRILSVLITGILFLPGVLVYMILRPRLTLEEEYQKSLEEEALLHTIEDSPICTGCGRPVKPDWVLCPICYAKLKNTCPKCGQLNELSWNLCPYCGNPNPGVRIENDSDLGSPFDMDLPTNMDAPDEEQV